MISIFKNMNSEAAPQGSARALFLLSEALKLNMIRANGLNHEELAASLDTLAEMSDRGEAEAPMVEAGGKACGEVQSYFLHLGQSIDSVGFDLAMSIRALATLLHGNSGNQEEFLGKMEQIRDKFQVGHTLDDIHQLRLHLDSCLTSLRSELCHARHAQVEHKAAMAEHLTQLNKCVSSLRSKVPPKHTTGPALLILRVRRLKTIRERYGEDVAKKILDYVTQILLVRWPAAYDITPYGDECLVILDSENLDLEFHRNALRKLTSERHVITTKLNGRETLLPLAMDLTVIRAPADGDMEEFIRNFLDGMTQKDNHTAVLDKTLGLNA